MNGNGGGVRGLVVSSIVLLGVGFVFTAVGSVWSITTPEGTGVNFPAGAMYMVGMAVGVLGLTLGVVAIVSVNRALGLKAS